MMDMTGLELLAAPFCICLVLTGIHCYLGIHVLERGVIFVDLALAQIAALGTTTALLLGYAVGTPHSYILSLLFTMIGAAVFSLARFRDDRVPQEAIIGITFAVASSLAILVLDKSPHGHEELESMLVGSILYVTWLDVAKTAAIYVAVGLLHFVYRERFLLISQDVDAARARGWSIRLWDFLFYVTFGVVVTSSVRLAGVLLVFSYLVVPTVCAMLFARRVRSRLLLGWLIGFIASVVGLYLSLQFDLPTGASVVATFGGVLILCSMMYAASRFMKSDLPDATNMPGRPRAERSPESIRKTAAARE